MTYEEGSDYILVFKTLNYAFDKLIPDRSSKFPFKAFPYNSRYCHLQHDNIIVITGGCLWEQGCCLYDYDMNYLCELPDMSANRQMHSMVNIGKNVYVIGGLGVKSVECFNLDYETWDTLPDLNYDRRDPGVCVVDDCFIYVFMGYSQYISDICKNFERFDTKSLKGKWELLPVNDYVGYMLRTHCGVVRHDDGFLIVGGFAAASKSLASVCYFDVSDFTLKQSDYKLPFSATFAEKCMFNLNDNESYLFTYATLRLIKFDKKLNCFVEIK
jgi:hypothetical protein